MRLFVEYVLEEYVLLFRKIIDYEKSIFINIVYRALCIEH